ncbi:hypothetical protein [Pararhodobacter aggregans]|uniref:Uncharacterized protein n=1 Tax=Pararhodobacter aggregans TaxID=404875 RepID=A0A2T7URN7_9RHOB|nr:hypothetical protein [Pararhodobacter aggregans]PTX01045.1 hypothetical protein C8N33_1082 [Pararhodobacter aggregans]PVE47248.1 hypothetical protein DDE23_13495 [Pararhodobacter aggregans]
MNVRIAKPAQILRAKLARPSTERARLLPQLRFTGNATATSFALPQGQAPYAVFAAGALLREGAADDYTTTFDGFVHRVVFAVAPASGDDVTIWPVEA